MSGTPENTENARAEALDHAWDWFSLHATQRLQSINFFLVAIAFLSAAFVTAAKEKMNVLAGGIAVTGACVSFFFYRMDRRIRSLLHAAEYAMEPLEGQLAKQLKIDALSIVAGVRNPQRGEWLYSKVFRHLFFTTGAAFVLGLLYAVWDAFSATPASVEFRIVVHAVIGIVLAFFGYEMLVSSPRTLDIARIDLAREWALLIMGIVCVASGIGTLLLLVKHL